MSNLGKGCDKEFSAKISTVVLTSKKSRDELTEQPLKQSEIPRFKTQHWEKKPDFKEINSGEIRSLTLLEIERLYQTIASYNLDNKINQEINKCESKVYFFIIFLIKILFK